MTSHSLDLDSDGAERGVDIASSTDSPDGLFLTFNAYRARHADAPSHRVERYSWLAGMGGIAAFASFLLSMTILLLSSLDFWLPRPPSLFAILLILGTLCGPAAAGLSMLAFFPFFESRSVLVQMGIATVLFVPVYVFTTLAMSLSWENFGDHWDLFMMFATYVLGAGLIAVIVQFWFRHSLAPYRVTGSQTTPLTLRSLFELTGFAALLLAIWRIMPTSPYMTFSLIVAFFLGIASGFVLLIAAFGLLRARRSKSLMLAAFVIAILAASTWCAMIYYFDRSRLPSVNDAGLLLIDGMVLGGVYSGTLWLGIRWLRGFGWSVVES